MSDPIAKIVNDIREMTAAKAEKRRDELYDEMRSAINEDMVDDICVGIVRGCSQPGDPIEDKDIILARCLLMARVAVMAAKL